MDQYVIDGEELTEYIFDVCQKKGLNISEETINLILDLEMEYLESKGMGTEKVTE